jgi:hypothetical protein
MSDGDMKRKPKMEDSSKSLREHLTAPIKNKRAHQGHGMSQDVSESVAETFYLTKQRSSPVNHTLGVK